MIQELTWDTGFFGRKIGRITEVRTCENLCELLAEAKKQQYEYLICRVMADEIFTVQMLEKQSFYLIDIGMVWERGIAEIEAPLSPAKDGTSEDIDSVKKIASGLFKYGRFFHDPFFTDAEAERLYQTWAENLAKGIADKVFLIKDQGFITCKVSDNAGNIPLIGVSAEYRGRGIGTALVFHALRWFKERDVKSVNVRTQSSNMNAIKFYEHCGFKVKAIDITMAKILTF